MWNFNPRSPHGERLLEQTREIKVTAISIHAPRTGSDRYAIEDILRLQISIHAPRTGSDVRKLKALTRDEFAFQSTLPARGATSTSRIYLLYWSFQSTLPARGATVSLDTLVGRDEFQSTLPARGATSWAEFAPRWWKHFNPRSPHGERRVGQRSRRAGGSISIHAPRTGSDRVPRPAFMHQSNFNPRSPHGERHYHLQGGLSQCHFNPRSPHGERLYRIPSTRHDILFQSTLPARGATNLSAL